MTRLTSDLSKSKSPSSLKQIKSRKTTATTYRDLWEKVIRVRSPMLYLDERFRYPDSTSVPTLHFGLGFTKESLMYCARRRQLLSSPFDEEQDDEEKESGRVIIALMEVRNYLQRKLKITLFMHSVICPDYLGVFTLYSNHTRHRLHRPKREGEILNTLRRELDVRKQQAAWYWDGNHGVGYVCKHDEFNP